MHTCEKNAFFDMLCTTNWHMCTVRRAHNCKCVSNIFYILLLLAELRVFCNRYSDCTKCTFSEFFSSKKIFISLFTDTKWMPTCVIYLKSIYKKKSNRLNTELFVYSGYFNGHFSAEKFSSSKQKNIKKKKIHSRWQRF